MHRKLKRWGIRMGSFVMAMMMLVTPAFALVREVEVYGVKSINDMGGSDQRIDMDTLKETYKDFVQTDTLREYFHQDQNPPSKVDLDQALSWLIDNNIISRDANITVSNVGSNSIPVVSISKFDTSELKAMEVMRTDMLMYVYKAVFGPINARTIGVETDNIRVDNGAYITLRDLMIKNGYTLNPSNTLPGSGTITIPGNHGAEGGAGGGPGSPGGAGGDATGSDHQTNYINDFSNWRYQPQGDLWESIFGDTNIFISQNNFNQNIEGGNGGPGGPGGNASANNGGTAIGGGGGGGGSTNTGDNIIDYDTDYKQIYFIPGADLLVYTTSDVPEVYIQAALSKGLLGFESKLRTDEFNNEFVNWPASNPNTKQSWDKGSPTYVVNRSRNILKTVTKTEQVATQFVLGKCWNVSWSGGTLTLSRNTPFANRSGYFTSETVSKMDAYRYIYHFVHANEKVLSDLERDIVNYKYGMELDGITSEEDSDIIKYLIAKGIINYEITNEFMELSAPISWSEFITLLYRTANKEARLDFSQVQLTDSEAQWKAGGYAPQTNYVVPGDSQSTVQLMTREQMNDINFGTQGEEGHGGETVGFSDISQQTNSDGRNFVRFGAAEDLNTIVQFTKFGDSYFYGITTNFEGAIFNSASDNGYENTTGEDINKAVQLFGCDRPQSSLGKYVLGMLYKMTASDVTKSMLEATWTKGYSEDNPKLMLMKNVCCNLWAISDMQKHSSMYTEVLKMIKKAGSSNQTDALKEALGDNNEAFRTAVATLEKTIIRNVAGSGTLIGNPHYLFWNGTTEVPSTDWVAYTGGSLEKLVNGIVGVEFTVYKSDGSSFLATFNTPALAAGTTRARGSAYDILKAGNDTTVIQSQTLVGEHWSEEQKEAALREYSNSVASFSNLESVATTVGLLTYIDPETSECFVAWSTLERYKQSCKDSGKNFSITKISDYILYNEETNTYAYFSDEREKKIALVGTDVVTGSSDKGVVYRDGSDIYYHIDALRLLMDAKQEAEVLGGVRSMPLASAVVQNNLSKISLDNNNGIVTQSLTGIQVMVSDNDTLTTANLIIKDPNKSGVYFTDTQVYNNVRWGNYIAISQANRAINAISKQFSYTSSTTGEKMTAYALVIFEPVSPSALESVTVDPNSSLQDLLDAPMKSPETEEGKKAWEQNKTRCNAYANWVYGTTGREYISTGYMIPHAYIYASDPDVVASMSEAAWSPLQSSERELVSVHQFKNISNGAVLKVGASRVTWTADKVRNDPDHRANYLLSDDYRACVMGNRLYLHLGCFKNITMYQVNGEKRLRTTGISMGAASFTVGSTFYVSGYASANSRLDGQPAPKIKVIKTETDGTVTCQVGPIKGVPMVYDNKTPVVIHDYATKATGLDSLNNFDWTSEENSQVHYAYNKMFNNNSYSGIELMGISSNPVLSSDSTRVFVFNGDTITQMKEDARVKSGPSMKCYMASCMKPSSDISKLLPAMSATDAYRGFNSRISETNVETYFTIKFNAFYYTLQNGILTYSPNQASDYISPSLFTSLNDLIINEMISADNGAIPVEEIPFGSLLQIGTGYYTATGTSKDDISFVGYAPLELTGGSVTHATLQEVAKSYSTHFIRAGNQQLNVSHFFKDIEVLPAVTDYMDSLNVVKDAQLSKDNVEKRYILGAEGTLGIPQTGVIMGSATGSNSVQVFYYAPVKITFQPGLLLAYTNTPAEETPAQYQLIPNAVSSVSGPLDELPFFSANALSGGLVDKTNGMYTGGFMKFYGSNSLLETIRGEFQKAFAGDLFTLARMIVFIILIWLVVASWMCYAIYFGRLMPILDAIRYPTGNRQGKGIDLMKIVSLGSISMETDFKLGRFIQYNLVLAGLICVVWFTGIYL